MLPLPLLLAAFTPPFGTTRRAVLSGATAASVPIAFPFKVSALPPPPPSREAAVQQLLGRVPVYLVANERGEPYLTEVDAAGKRSGSVFLGPRDAAAVLQDVRKYDRSATLAVVPLSTIYDDVAKTAADAATARQSVPQPRESTSTDMRLFQLLPLSDENSGAAVSMLPGASLVPGVPLFYEPTLFLGTSEAERVRPFAFRLQDLNTVWRQGEGDERNAGRISPSLRTLTLEGLVQRYAEGLEPVPPLLLPPSETAELEYRAAGEDADAGGAAARAGPRSRTPSMMADEGRSVQRVLVCVGHLCECQGDAASGARALLRELNEREGLTAPVQETPCLGMCGMGAMGCVEYTDGTETLVAGRDQMLGELKLDTAPPAVPESCLVDDGGSGGGSGSEGDANGGSVDRGAATRVLVCTGRMCQREKGGGTLLLDELQSSYASLPAESSPCLGCCGQGSMIQVEYEDGCEPAIAASNVPRLSKTLERLGLSAQAAAAKPVGRASTPWMSAAWTGAGGDGDGNTFSVSLPKPLGLMLEERVAGASGGVEVGSTVEGSAAEKCGLLQPGDVLLRVGETDVSGMSFDEVMEALVGTPSPVSLTMARATYEDDDKPLDITPNLAKSLKPEDAVLVDRTVRAARAALRASPGASRQLGRLLRIEIIVGAGVQKGSGEIKVRFFAIFTTGGASSYSCNVSATGRPSEGDADGAGAIEIVKLSCAKDEGWGNTVDLL